MALGYTIDCGDDFLSILIVSIQSVLNILLLGNLRYLI
jgi:hypothetical protein